MHSLKTLILEYFKDTLYEVTVKMVSSRDQKFTIVTDNIRGIAGVTVVTILKPAEVLSDNSDKEMSLLKIKFFQLDESLQNHLRRMSAEAMKIEGVEKFIPKMRTARKVFSRIYR
jgi:hypothetical protein